MEAVLSREGCQKNDACALAWCAKNVSALKKRLAQKKYWKCWKNEKKCHASAKNFVCLFKIGCDGKT
jgi:hypothetical protein